KAKFPRSVSPNLVEERVGSGTAGWGPAACRTALSQTGRPRPFLAVLAVFCSEISAKLIIDKTAIREPLPMIPYLRNSGKSRTVLPTATLLPVLPDLSGPDQARSSVPYASRPRED